MNMTAIRKIVDSSTLADLFDLPPAFENRKVEVLLYPVDEPEAQSAFPLLTMEQIDNWAKAPEIQSLVGVLKGAGLPEDIKINDIRDERHAEKYKV